MQIYWCTIFQARNEGERHHHYENILRYVPKAPDGVRWEIDRNEFDELMATKESAPGPDGIQKSLYRCAGGLGFAVSLQRIQTYSGGWYYPCAFRRRQNCVYSRVRQRRQ